MLGHSGVLLWDKSLVDEKAEEDSRQLHSCRCGEALSTVGVPDGDGGGTGGRERLPRAEE